MAKPILCYVLARGWSRGRGFRVIGVTSEKGGQVYGRDERDGATHIGEFDVIHRFPEGTTLDFAQAAGKRADEESERHRIGIQQARAELSRLEDVRQAAILAAAKGAGFDKTRPMSITPDGRGYFCTNCCRPTPRDFCPRCGAPAPPPIPAPAPSK